MAATRRSKPTRVHGPCEKCGATYYSVRTGTPTVCPNCGHREGCSD